MFLKSVDGTVENYVLLSKGRQFRKLLRAYFDRQGFFLQGQGEILRISLICALLSLASPLFCPHLSTFPRKDSCNIYYVFPPNFPVRYRVQVPKKQFWFSSDNHKYLTVKLSEEGASIAGSKPFVYCVYHFRRSLVFFFWGIFCKLQKIFGHNQ